MGETREDKTVKLKELENLALKIEKSFPLVIYKANNEMEQLKYFILKYYEPILTVMEKT